MRPGPSVSTSKVAQPVEGDVDESLRKKLISWRRGIFDTYHHASPLAPSAILDNATVTMLACYGAMSYQQLESLLEARWIWLRTYRATLHQYWESLKLPERMKKPRKRTTKTKAPVGRPLKTVSFGSQPHSVSK